MTHPTIDDARGLARSYGLDRVVIYFQTGDGRNGYASFGKTRELCYSTKAIADQMLRVAEGATESSRLS